MVATRKSQSIVYQLIAIYTSDPDRIQTCNPQSRNLIFYSVELRGPFILYLFEI